MGLALLLLCAGCLEVAGHPIVLGLRDANTTRDAGDAGERDGGRDAGFDGAIPDGGSDAGPPDAGFDAFVPDGGCPSCPPRIIDVVTRDPLGRPASGRTFLFYDISQNGRYVGFATRAENLVTGDTNGFSDVFLLDRVAGTMTLVSTTATGEQATNDSSFVAISDDGRFVAFGSLATNLVPGDDNGVRDLFVKDLTTGAIERASVSSDEAQSNGPIEYASMSADGRYVAFRSSATNLVAGDDNGTWDVFVRDREAGVTFRVSESPTGESGNGESNWLMISNNGRYVAYSTAASNLGPIDANGNPDIYLYDRVDRTTELVSRNASGVAGNYGSIVPRISADGRFIAYRSAATNLVPADTTMAYNCFLFDRMTSVTERVDVADDGTLVDTSVNTSVSDDGRFVAFASGAAGIVPSDTNVASDIFIRDRTTGRTFRIVPDDGEANAESGEPILSGDGGFVLFRSAATDWVPMDENGEPDIFIAPVDPI
jgi:Tol biopolymer transport system component